MGADSLDNCTKIGAHPWKFTSDYCGNVSIKSGVSVDPSQAGCYESSIVFNAWKCRFSLACDKDVGIVHCLGILLICSGSHYKGNSRGRF